MAKRKYRKYSNRWRKEFNMIKGFIEKCLGKKLRDDQLACKILGEADLQSCVFSHLQKYFKDKKLDDKWPILNEPTLEGVRPDFVICRRKAREYPPKIIIELKEKKTFAGKGTKGLLDRDTEKIIDLMLKNKNKPNPQRNRVEMNYLILAITTHEFAVACDAENDPDEIQRRMEKDIASKLKRRKIKKNKIKPIVINAFYRKDGKKMLEILEEIKKLRAVSIQKVNLGA